MRVCRLERCLLFAILLTSACSSADGNPHRLDAGGAPREVDAGFGVAAESGAIAPGSATGVNVPDGGLALADGSTILDAARPERYPASADTDSDGLLNALELQLHTDPEYADTDGDGLSDAQEVGSRPESPLDSDADGFIDALESRQLDNDRDGKPDQGDPAEQGAWQLVTARVTPAVIANDGIDATTIEAQLTGIRAERVTIGMDSRFWFPLLAPDELRVDGEMIGRGRIELFDDGTRGDRIAGDGVYARNNVTTTMKARKLSDEIPLTPRWQVTLGSIEVTTSGQTVVRQLGRTDGSDASLFPGMFWIRIVDATVVREARELSSDAQQTDYVLNVIDAKKMLATQALLTGESAEKDQAVSLLVSIADRLPAHVDFLYVYPSVVAYGGRSGAHQVLSNDVTGIGRPIDPAFPVDRGLKGLVVLNHATESPIHHETMHQWAVHLDLAFGFDTASGHWGTAGTMGVLGGFRAGSLVDHGNGTYTVERFEPNGGEWTTTPYSDIELYLMGLIPAQQVMPIPVLVQPSILSGTPTTVTVSAQLRTVRVEDLVAKHGARTPVAGSAQTQFKAAFVVASDRKLTRAELAFIDSRARAVETTTPNEAISFPAATRGIGTMVTKLGLR